jgi:iron-sulfur cluster assembly accessory protein
MSLIAIGRKKGKEPAKEVVTPDMVGEDEIFITAVAAAQVAKKAGEEGVPGGMLRIAVQAGGCSGLSYIFSYVTEPTEKDRVFERDGHQVCVDPRSLKALGGTVLDWDQALGRSGFVMRNPNATSTCSCGESFSVL